MFAHSDWNPEIACNPSPGHSPLYACKRLYVAFLAYSGISYPIMDGKFISNMYDYGN